MYTCIHVHVKYAMWFRERIKEQMAMGRCICACLDANVNARFEDALFDARVIACVIDIYRRNINDQN